MGEEGALRVGTLCASYVLTLCINSDVTPAPLELSSGAVTVFR